MVALLYVILFVAVSGRRCEQALQLQQYQGGGGPNEFSPFESIAISERRGGCMSGVLQAVLEFSGAFWSFRCIIYRCVLIGTVGVASVAFPYVAVGFTDAVFRFPWATSWFPWAILGRPCEILKALWRTMGGWRYGVMCPGHGVVLGHQFFGRLECQEASQVNGSFH